MKYLKLKQPFQLECGEVLPEIDIAYATYGTLNVHKDNVVWICHALTANADAADWWSGLVGEGKLFDTRKYFIVCANMLGSCYGATNANSINPLTGKRYGKDFPLITVRDVVNSHRLLQQYLGIHRIRIGAGGSMGGQQLLEWSIIDKFLFDQIVVLAVGAQLTPWSRGWNAAQRMALEADPTLYEDNAGAGEKGLEAARAIGMICYRTYDAYNQLQADDDQALDNYKIESYLRYQGVKLRKRFTPLSYLSVTRTMDSHNVGRNRGGVEKALNSIQTAVLVIGISSDLLFPIEEQTFLATHIPNATLAIIDSDFGHDGFLIENEVITNLVSRFMKKRKLLMPYWLKNTTKTLDLEIKELQLL